MDIAQLIQDLGIEKSAILHGSQSNVNGFLRKSDVFWATSQVTNWPSNSLMEALASGLPVVATNTGLTNELIVDKINGLLVLPSNAEEIVVSTERILKEGALRRKLAINARATAENNDVKKIYPKIAHLYYSILNQ